MADLARLAAPGSEEERLLAAARPRPAPAPRRRSSWTATGAGPASAGCRASPGTARGSPSVRDIGRDLRPASDLEVADRSTRSRKENWKRPQDRGRLPDGAPAGVHAARSCDDAAREQHPRPGHRAHGRPAAPSCRRSSHARGRGDARRTPASCSTSRSPTAGRAEIVDACRALLREGVRPRGRRRGDVRAAPLHRGPARSRPPDPHRAARCACRTSCCGRSPTPRSGSPTTLWPDFRRRDLVRGARSTTSGASAASAALSPRESRRRPSSGADRAGMTRLLTAAFLIPVAVVPLQEGALPASSSRSRRSSIGARGLGVLRRCCAARGARPLPVARRGARVPGGRLVRSPGSAPRVVAGRRRWSLAIVVGAAPARCARRDDARGDARRDRGDALPGRCSSG